MENAYQYETQLQWTGMRCSWIRAEGLPDLGVSSTPELAGSVGMWTPEQLLVASVEGCFMTTFLNLAALAKLHIGDYRSRAVGKLKRVPGQGYLFTNISLMPEIEVADADLERAQEILRKAEEHCIISNSIRARLIVQPRFIPASAAVEAA